MFICLCNAITEKMLEEDSSLEIGTKCGACLTGRWLLSALETSLKQHNWMYADKTDLDNWGEGLAAERRINQLMNKAAEQGLGEEAAELHNKYNPSANKDLFKEKANYAGSLKYNNGNFQVVWTTKRNKL